MATSPEGITIDLTIDNKNDNDSNGAADARGGGNGYGYGYGGQIAYPVAVGAAGDATEAPEDSTEDGGEEADAPAPYVPAPVQCPPPRVCPQGLSSPGTFFCMTKRTFVIVIVMMILASILVSVGYWIYRKKLAAPSAGAGGNSGFGDLGGLGGDFGGMGGGMGGPR